jgi:hypothetical protein
MYCHQCGGLIDGRPRFCHLCGVSLQDSSVSTTHRSGEVSPLPRPREVSPLPRPREVNVRVPRLAVDTGQLKGRGGWRSISGSGGLLMLVAFFLSWVSASCDPRALGLSGASAQNLPTLHFSGFDLAIGPRIDMGFGVQQASGSVGLWLVPAAALTILACALFMTRHRLAAGTMLAAALISLLPLLSTWQSFENQRNTFTKITPEIGLWLTLLGVAIGAIGALVGLSSSGDHALPRPTGGAYVRQPARGQPVDAGLVFEREE